VAKFGDDQLSDSEIKRQKKEKKTVNDKTAANRMAGSVSIAASSTVKRV